MTDDFDDDVWDGGMLEGVGDGSAALTVHDHRQIWRGHRGFDVVDAEVEGRAGRGPTRLAYEVLRVGEVVAVLPYDPVLDRLVVIRQFRLGAHLAHGRGENIEVIAGRIDAGETPEQAARREALEEAGVVLENVEPALVYVPLAAAADELVHLFFARCDASALPEVAGLASDQETIFPLALPAAALMSAARHGALANGHLLMALSWFTLRRPELEARWKAAP